MDIQIKLFKLVLNQKTGLIQIYITQIHRLIIKGESRELSVTVVRAEILPVVRKRTSRKPGQVSAIFELSKCGEVLESCRTNDCEVMSRIKLAQALRSD